MNSRLIMPAGRFRRPYERHQAARMALHGPIHDAHAAARNFFLHHKPRNELDALFFFLGKCRD